MSDQAITPWLGSADLKAKTLAAYDTHIAQDTLVRGVYGEEATDGTFQGCHIGCLLHVLTGASAASIEEMDSGERLRAVRDATGLPCWLTELSEYFFEGLPPPRNQQVTRSIMDAVSPGAGLGAVKHRFVIWCLTDDTYGWRQHCDDAEKAATDKVVALHTRAAAGESVSDAEWEAARADARDAAWAAAIDDASAAVWAAAWADAMAAARDAQANALVRLLAEASA